MYIQPLFKSKNFGGLLLDYKGPALETIRTVLEHGVKNG